MIGDGTIRNCRAKEYGGGVALNANDAAAELTGGIITGCKAGKSGGGAACLFGKLTVDGCAVYDNTAANRRTMFTTTAAEARSRWARCRTA